METGKRDILKKNVQNTLEGMKKFFNEYDEKKMFQKLKNASPNTLKKMMKVIPKFVSLEDDFLNAYGYPLTAGLDSSIGVQPVEREGNFITRNPYTTAGAGVAATAATKPGRKFLGKAFNLGTGPMGAGWLTYALRPEGGYDLKRPEDRITFEAEAALAPTLVKGAQSVTEKVKNPFLRKLAETGAGIRIPGLMSPTMLMRAARIASPIGWLSLAGEGLYHAGKKEMAKRAQMSAEELDAYMLENQSRGWSRMANGGIMSLKKKW